jgi:trans-2,3-dihydro-3-hydroxyanthranilate isomerase
VVRAEAAAGLRLLSAAHRLTWLDVFTSTPLAGNGLAVVHDADEIDDETMLAFARETRLSETTFVQSPQRTGADYRNRIFTMNGELAFAGHPSLGTAVALARAAGERAATYVQETRAGLQPVEVELDGRAARASMLQEPADFGAFVDPSEALAALGLVADDAHAELPPQVVSTGIPHLLIPARDASVLDRVVPDADAVRALLRSRHAELAYLTAVDQEAGTAHARGIWTSPYGLAEDPATGSAAGPLLAYLSARTGVTELTVTQGVAIGRPSRLDCAIVGDRVRVAGDVVILVEGEVWL